MSSFHDDPVDPDVQRLLDDASAPAGPGELAGMSQAVTWFAAQPARRSWLPAFVTGLLAAKVLMPVAAAAAVSGIALAAATGSLPAPAQDAASSLGAPRSDRAVQADEKKAKEAGDKERSFRGLCNAYDKGNKGERGKARQSTAFTALVDAAGGEGKVAAFCVKWLADNPQGPDEERGKPTGTPGEGKKPADAGKPSVLPSGKPSDAGKPSDLPTGGPSEVPVGKPSDAGRPSDAGKPSDLPNAPTG